MSSAGTSGASSGASSGRGPLVIVLTVIGILAIIAGILYVAGAANSIHFMVGSVHHGHHQIRAIVSFVVGIACLIGAYIVKTRPAGGSPGASASGNANASGNASASGAGGADGTASTSGTESGSTSTSGS